MIKLPNILLMLIKAIIHSTIHHHLILNRNILFIYTHTPCHSLMLSHINHYSQTLGILPTTVLKKIKPVYRKKNLQDSSISMYGTNLDLTFTKEARKLDSFPMLILLWLVQIFVSKSFQRIHWNLFYKNIS